MYGKNYFVMAVLLVLTGCVNPIRNDIADAIDLCGSIGKLQAANTYYMGDVKSLLVIGKAKQKITYPELTPELRASAMRSTSHCINLQLGKIEPDIYDKLMTLEATNAAAAERALTNEQLEALIEKGYRKVADILREAHVSESAIAKVGAITTADVTFQKPSKENAEIQALTDINAKVVDLKTTLKEIPAEVVKAMKEAPKKAKNHLTTPLIKVLFSPRAATLDSTALLALSNSIADLGSDAQLSVVGSADAGGDELKNMELSRLRAQSVAAWLMVNHQIEPQRIHVGALGAKKGAAISAEDRSVTVFKY